MITSFYNLFEWRKPKHDSVSPPNHKINEKDYSIIIDESNCYCPIYTQSMEYNNAHLSEHLAHILRLAPDNTEPCQLDREALSDQEIIDQALQHDLPIFISIDGSLSDDGIATVSISIVAPDIRESDMALEWKERIAKVLLIRSWRLPSVWGTSKVCINMAESIGFILGDYTIPAHIPVIYITDSNNARTLQRNLTCLSEYTHRKQIRCIKQGIDFSIASHLEFLTQKWPKAEQISEHHRRLYIRGERVCKIWADSNKPQPKPEAEEDNNSSAESSINDSNDELSCTPNECLQIQKKKARYAFNHNMYDYLGNIIILKVFSHQLNKDFEVSITGKSPQPNMFTASANQIADNAANQAHHLSTGTHTEEYDKVFYPPFSPKWCFSFEGNITNKGATKVFQEKLDMELMYRQQHRSKQGMFFRLLPFVGLNAQQLGDESLLRNIIKMTAPCWTRCLYRYPPLGAQAWESWFCCLPPEEQEYFPSTLPKDWKKDKFFSDLVVRVCPACGSHRTDPDDPKVGTLEHMHLYCMSPHLTDARSHCYQKIESALAALYNYASLLEYNKPTQDAMQQTKLQENFEHTAHQTELEERPVCKDSKVVMETRSSNIAILSRHQIQIAILHKRLPTQKLQDYDKYPLAHRAGLIHSMSEETLSMDSATIIDVNFLGLFPKSLLAVLRSYKQSLNKDLQSDFDEHINQLLSAVIYRPIVIQCIIQYLLAAIKLQLEEEDAERQQAPSNQESANSGPLPKAIKITKNKESTPKMCHANKCRLLLAKGIIRRPMICAKSRHMCSGCICEETRQRKAATLELELMETSTSNPTLAPMIQFLSQPISIKNFRKLFKHLPTMNYKK